MVPLLLGVSVVNFAIIRLAPGSPMDLMASPTMSAETRARLEHTMGFDAPVYRQYASWLLRVVRGDLGYSYTSYRPVAAVIAERLPATLLLMGSALLVGLALAIPLGVVSALKQRRLFDYLAAFAAFAGVSTPNFFLALGLIYCFSVKFKVFPSSGMYTLGAEGGAADLLRHLAMPCAVLAVNICGRFIRYVRSSMLDVLHQDYLRTAAAKGVPFLPRLGVHAFRNALLPVITLVGLEIPGLFSGAVVTEQIFSWPGIGRLTIDSVMTRDYPVLMGLNLMATLMVLVAGLLTDILYGLADPRINYGS
jgi:peptide/nickel transport system permease protein